MKEGVDGIVWSVQTTHTGSVQQEHRTFSTMTDDLLRGVDWLAVVGCRPMAVEPTGIYWKPLYNLLEGAVEILVVNAHPSETSRQPPDMTAPHRRVRHPPDRLDACRRTSSSVPSLTPSILSSWLRLIRIRTGPGRTTRCSSCSLPSSPILPSGPSRC